MLLKQQLSHILVLRVSVFFTLHGDPETPSSGSSFASPALSAEKTQDVAVLSVAFDAIYCVPPLPRDLPLTTGKPRFAYSLTVVHFRKLRYK